MMPIRPRAASLTGPGSPAVMAGIDTPPARTTCPVCNGVGFIDLKTACSSMPMFTTEYGDTVLTVIRVSLNAGLDISHQVYAVADGTWNLVGIHRLYTDALVDVQGWRRYLAEGHTLAEWTKAHPHGVKPDVAFHWQKIGASK